jgi:hypothetical protein
MGAQVLKDMMQASLVDMSAQLTRPLHTAVTIYMEVLDMHDSIYLLVPFAC